MADTRLGSFRMRNGKEGQGPRRRPRPGGGPRESWPPHESQKRLEGRVPERPARRKCSQGGAPEPRCWTRWVAARAPQEPGFENLQMFTMPYVSAGLPDRQSLDGGKRTLKGASVEDVGERVRDAFKITGQEERRARGGRQGCKTSDKKRLRIGGWAGATRPPVSSGRATRAEGPALGATRLTQPRDEAPPGLWNQARRAPNAATAPGLWLSPGGGRHQAAVHVKREVSHSGELDGGRGGVTRLRLPHRFLPGPRRGFGASGLRAEGGLGGATVPLLDFFVGGGVARESRVVGKKGHAERRARRERGK
eukprot:350157-Chlamydomonas_euryale.AAC.1